jgi:hypothetical protein
MEALGVRSSTLVTPTCDMSCLTLIACRWLNVINKALPILVILESMEHIIHHSIYSSIFMYLLPLRSVNNVMYNGIFVPETIKEKAKEENKMLSLGITIREHAMNTEYGTKRKRL